MKKVIKLTESDLEKLVQRIIKEEDVEQQKPTSTSSMKKDITQTGKELGGLVGLEKEGITKLNLVIKKLNEPGNQITGNAKNLLVKLFKEFGV
jgi:DNA-binding protein H-NS